MTMTERLLEATKEIWAGYNEKPFVKGIADGSLDHEKFKFYMIQDYLYLLDYTKVFSIGAAKAKDLDAMRLFAGYTHSILDGEMDIHRAYMERLGITKEEAERTAPWIIYPTPPTCSVWLTRKARRRLPRRSSPVH